MQVPEGHPRQARLLEYPLVQVVELVELIWRSGLGVEEHIVAGFQYAFQKMFRLTAEHQQPLALDIPAADMVIGPRQGDEFTLPQAAGQFCVDEREYTKRFRCVQVPLNLPQAQRGGRIFLCRRFLAEPYRITGNDLVTSCFVHAAPQEQMVAPLTYLFSYFLSAYCCLLSATEQYHRKEK